MYELCSRLRAAEFGGRSGMPSLSTSRMELCPCVGCITFLNTLSVSWTSVEENEHITKFNPAKRCTLISLLSSMRENLSWGGL